MKDWEYYSTPKAKYYGYEAKKKYKDELVAVIDSTPLTTDERKQRMDDVPKLVRSWAAEKNEPYNKELQHLHTEFFDDARKDLGYEDWLNNVGVSNLECKAWEMGHSSGFSEVYYHLHDLYEFLTDMKDCFK